MKRIISWIEPRRSRFERFSNPEPLGFYIASDENLLFSITTRPNNEKKSSGNERGLKIEIGPI